MKRFIYKTLIFCALIAFIGLTSCRPRQQIIRSDTRVAEKSASELFSDVIVNHFPYTTFSARLNMNLSMGTRSVSSRANLRIIREQALQVSVQMPIIGIMEVFRLYIDPYSIVIIDRMNRRYVNETIASLQAIYPIGFDFHTLQSLFTNMIFVSGQNEVTARDYRRFTYSLTNNDMHYLLEARDRRSDIAYSFIVNGDDRVIQTRMSQRDNALQWEYDQFAMVGNVAFPHRMNVNLSTATRMAIAEMTFSNIAVNESFQLSPNIPNGFTRTSISEILRIITVLL